MNIGSVQVFLQPVAYMVEMKEQLEITDLKGNKIGVMNVSKDFFYLLKQRDISNISISISINGELILQF